MAVFVVFAVNDDLKVEDEFDSMRTGSALFTQMEKLHASGARPRYS